MFCKKQKGEDDVTWISCSKCRTELNLCDKKALLSKNEKEIHKPSMEKVPMKTILF